MGLGFAAFGAELPELEARCHERLYYARPTVLAGPRTRRGRRLIIYYHGPGKLWCNKNRHTGLKSIIPVDKRDRTVIEQDMEGDYQLHSSLIQEFTRIQQEISRKKA